MRAHIGYCGYCSVEAVDRRKLVYKDGYITCAHCGGKTKLEPIYEGSSYVRLKRANNVVRKS